MADKNPYVESVVAEGVNALGESVKVYSPGEKVFLVRFADVKRGEHVLVSATSLDSLEQMGFKLKKEKAGK